MKRTASFYGICYIVPVLVFASIWFPVIVHYYVPGAVITDELLNKARELPDHQVFEELNGFRFLDIKFKDDKELVLVAEKLLEGELKLPWRPATRIGMPFDAEDIDKGLPSWKLYIASFAVPDILLRAYKVTARDDFIMMARDVIVAWALYEGSAWLPKGLLWNDHAIAARIPVLAEFWSLYRNHPDYQPEVAKVMFQLVARSGQFLAKPTHFTFSTNHGATQNLALWHICLAFPTLPTVDQYKQLALNRMRDQMTFLVSDEGVMLEHSANYHRSGLRVMGKAFRYLTLMNIPIPEDFRRKYEKAKSFYAQLRRPYGSLPDFGDTRSGLDPFGPPITNVDARGRSEALYYKKDWIPQQRNSLYPVDGYSIWWDGLDSWPNSQKLSQTVVAWSHFPGHAHKHADEMSVLLWAGGQTWWTNVGYWTYGTKGRSEAVSWAGSNAPHLLNESTHSERHTKLMSYGWSDCLSVIDLERRGPHEYVARRQVVQVKPNLWIVVDHTFGKESDRTTTTWTTSHEVSLSEGAIPGSYVLEAEKNSSSLTKFLLVSEDTNIMQFRGSFAPFAGWAANRPASAIVIEQPANDSWAVAIWSIQNSFGPTVKFVKAPSMQYWEGPEKWKIVLPLSSSVMNIWREDNRIFVNEDARGSDSPKEIILSETPQITDELAEIHTAYENAATKYPRKRFSLHRHFKETYLILFIFLLQEVFFFVYTRIGWKYSKELRVLSFAGWLALGIWVSS